MWDYGSANTKNIQKAVRNFDWEKAFGNLSVDRKVDFRNYIPNKKIKFNYRQPLWINDNIKRCLKERSKLTKFFYKNGQKREDKEKLEAEAVYCKEQIMKAKNDYTQRMTNKLNAPKAAPKTHWSILNRFLYNKKIPAIPPLLRNGKFVLYFCAKSNLSNAFFASICTPINNGSTIPPFAYKTNVRINSFRINHNDISLIIKYIDSNKVHGCGKIPIKMIQICGESIALPLKLLSETALKEKKFPDIWKLSNVVPAHKKEEKFFFKNYRPISLLPIISKIFERVIYNSFFNHFVSNKLFKSSQSGFLPGDSCIAQLLSIIHEIQTSFHSNLPVDVRRVFLDISKTFDKVSRKGLLYKLKS